MRPAPTRACRWAHRANACVHRGAPAAAWETEGWSAQRPVRGPAACGRVARPHPPVRPASQHRPAGRNGRPRPLPHEVSGVGRQERAQLQQPLGRRAHPDPRSEQDPHLGSVSPPGVQRGRQRRSAILRRVQHEQARASPRQASPNGAHPILHGTHREPERGGNGRPSVLGRANPLQVDPPALTPPALDPLLHRQRARVDLPMPPGPSTVHTPGAANADCQRLPLGVAAHHLGVPQRGGFGAPPVADLMHRQQMPRVLPIDFDLGAKAFDHVIDRPRSDRRPIAPHVPQQRFARDGTPFSLHQRSKQGDLEVGQRLDPPAPCKVRRCRSMTPVDTTRVVAPVIWAWRQRLPAPR